MLGILDILRIQNLNPSIKVGNPQHLLNREALTHFEFSAVIIPFKIEGYGDSLLRSFQHRAERV